MNNKIIISLLFFLVISNSARAEDSYSFTSNQKIRIATTILISQAMGRALYELGLNLNGRITISNALILGPAITAELLSEKPSKNNLISTGIGIVTSNLISISLDW